MPQPPPDLPGSPLAQSAQFLRGVGPARYDLLKRLGLETVGDVLFHLPRSYDDLSDVRPIGMLDSDQVQTAQGKIVEMEGRETSKGVPVVSIVISDGKDCLEGVWFHQPYVSSRFKFGQRVAFSGKPKWYKNHWQMSNPRVQALDIEEEDTPKILAVYPLTEDLRVDQLRKIIRHAVEEFAAQVSEQIPSELRELRKLPGVEEALRSVHFPPTLAAAECAAALRL